MNAIYYRFYSEKDFYEIRFNTTEMSIGDIKKEIIQRRNMYKCPEPFDLIFLDEENSTIIEDKDLVKPMKHLIIKRYPHYKKETNFVQIVRDPRDISMTKTNENNRRGELQQIMRYTDPLEKIAKKLYREMINKQFKCQICSKFDEETLFNPIISFCCKETFCLNCYNKDENKCPKCNSNKFGCVKNDAVSNLVKNLLKILEKKEEEEKLKKAAAIQQINAVYEQSAINPNDMAANIQRNIINNNLTPNANDNTNMKYTIPGGDISQYPINANINQTNLYPMQYQNPSLPLINGSQFFIIKSSIKENIEKSKRHSVWATTIQNSNRLNDAFKKGKVILIFSANASQSYQGYAIMTSFSADSPSNLWQVDNIKLAGDFSVAWLCYCELSFSKVKHLKNPKKNDELVIKSRDCTELSEEIGFELCKLCYEQEKKDLENNPQQNKLQINEQLINKITNDIKENKNKQLKKTNNKPSTSKEQSENLINNKPGEANNQNNQNVPNVVQPPMPQVVNPVMPMNPFYTMMYYNMYMRNMAALQAQDPNNLSAAIPIMNPQQQPKKQDNENDKNKKDKNKDNERDKDRDRDRDRRNKKEHKRHHHHSKYRRDRDRDRNRRSRSRSRSRSRDRSGSRSRNKSRSSRRSSSDSSKSEGRSKYSKSRK